MLNAAAAPPPAPGPVPAPVVGDSEQFLATLLAAMAPDDRQGKPGRPRILPALALWGGVLVGVRRGFDRSSARGRRRSQRQLWFSPRFPISDQAVDRRRRTAGPSPLVWLVAQVRDVLTSRLAPAADPHLAPFAPAVVALDESTLDAVARRLPALHQSTAADARRPGTLAAVCDLRRHRWRRVVHQPDPQQNEQVLARDLVADLPPGTLVVADLGYWGLAEFDHLTDQGVNWRARLRAKTSAAVRHTFSQRGDTLAARVWLGVHRADRARYAVPLVPFRTPRGLHRSVTTVLDRHPFPPAEMARVYARRWDIALAVDLVQTDRGRHLLWASQPVLVLQQGWAVRIIRQILQALRREIAGRAGVALFAVSRPLLVESLPRWMADGGDGMALLVADGRRTGCIRPCARTPVVAPHVPPDQIVPRPPGLLCHRPPRYAGRRCPPAPRPAAYAHE